MSKFCIIFITTADLKQARSISKALLKAKLVACVNIIKGIESLFWWQGKIDNAKETLLVIKTKKILFKKISELVSKLHSYDTPEIISFSLEKISLKYQRWLDASIIKSA
ncbi:MAG: divalent-cation tolerance protein CutA [Candidatus Omnitrophota bacterium]